MITPVSSDSFKLRLIADKKLLYALRLLWFVAMVFEAIIVLEHIPANLTAEVYMQYFLSPEIIMDLQRLGVAEWFFVGNTVLGCVNVAICFVLSSFLMWRSNDEPVAVLFALMLPPFMAASFFPRPDWAEHSIYYFQVAYFDLALFTWIFLFPDAHHLSRWTKYAYVAIVIVSVLVAFLSPEASVSFIPLFFILTAPLTIFRYRKAATLQKQQLKWLIVAIIANLFFYLVFFIVVYPLPTSDLKTLLGVITTLIIVILYAVWPLAIAFAIMRYRLWDIDLVINRSLVYGVVTLILMLVFSAGIILATTLTEGQGTSYGMIAGAVIAGSLFNPTRKITQRLIDRYVYRFNFDLNELAAAQEKNRITRSGILTGKILDGYEVQDVIASGGMGEVYRGQMNGTVVAIKTMLPKIAESAEMRKRFEREAQAGMVIDHPQIAKVYTYGETDGTPYLVMDFIDGETLRDYLMQHKLEERDTVQIMHNICHALAAAHHFGLIHRDLKPANIMIKPDGETVLMDFGIAKIADNEATRLTGTGAIGTIDYMSPEQITSAGTVDNRTDIYALGVMMYEMLTGNKPFSGSAAQVLFAQLQQPAPDPRDVNSAITRPVAKAVMRAMSKKPEERFDSVVEFAQALSA